MCAAHETSTDAVNLFLPVWRRVQRSHRRRRDVRSSIVDRCSMKALSRIADLAYIAISAAFVHRVGDKRWLIFCVRDVTFVRSEREGACRYIGGDVIAVGTIATVSFPVRIRVSSDSIVRQVAAVRPSLPVIDAPAPTAGIDVMISAAIRTQYVVKFSQWARHHRTAWWQVTRHSIRIKLIIRRSILCDEQMQKDDKVTKTYQNDTID
jgi:hypothetical protein